MNETNMLNQPLSIEEKFKIIVFYLSLIIISILIFFVLAGVFITTNLESYNIKLTYNNELFLTAVFLYFLIIPIVMTNRAIKKFRESNSCDPLLVLKKKLYNGYVIIVIIAFIKLITTINIFHYTLKDNFTGFGVASFIIVLFFVIFNLIYSNSFLDLLCSHQKWIVNNGIFSKKIENNTTSTIQNTSADELLKYAQLLEKGLISKAEFEEQKKKLLDRDNG